VGDASCGGVETRGVEAGGVGGLEAARRRRAVTVARPGRVLRRQERRCGPFQSA